MKPLLDFLKGKWLGHPLHPILAHVPMAMWPGALIFDLLSQCPIGGNAMVRLSFYAIIFGLAAALLAAPTGLVDWSGIKKEKPAWKIGLYHMSLNLIVTLLFAVNLALRWQTFREALEVDRIRFYFQPLARSFSFARLIWADEWFTNTASASRGCRRRNGASSLPLAAPIFRRKRRNRVERFTRRQAAAASDSSDAGSFSDRVSRFKFPARSR